MAQAASSYECREAAASVATSWRLQTTATAHMAYPAMCVAFCLSEHTCLFACIRHCVASCVIWLLVTPS